MTHSSALAAAPAQRNSHTALPSLPPPAVASAGASGPARLSPTLSSAGTVTPERLAVRCVSFHSLSAHLHTEGPRPPACRHLWRGSGSPQWPTFSSHHSAVTCGTSPKRRQEESGSWFCLCLDRAGWKKNTAQVDGGRTWEDQRRLWPDPAEPTCWGQMTRSCCTAV